MGHPLAAGRRPFASSLAIIGVLIVALAVRIWGLSDASIWIDESFTIATSSLPMSTLWLSAYDPTPPLYFTVEKFVLLFGDGEFLLRAPSVVFNVLTIYVMYTAARRVIGTRGALAVAIVLALSTANIEYAQEARAYSLLGFTISLAFLGLICLIQHVDDGEKKSTPAALLIHGGLLYAVASLAALYTHNIAVFFVLGVQAWFIALYFLQRDSFLLLIRPWVIANFVILVCWLPWLFASIEVSKTGVFSWLQHVGVSGAVFITREVHGFKFISTAQPLPDLGLALIIVTGLYCLKERLRVLALCLSLLLASSVIIWLFGFVKPVFMLRTILWGTLFSAFLFGASLSKLKMPIYIPVLAVFSVLGATNVLGYHDRNHGENEDWKGAAGFLAEHANRSEPMILCADYVKDAFAYYADEDLLVHNPVYGWSVDRDLFYSSNVTISDNDRPEIDWRIATADDVDALLAAKRLWIVKSHCNEQAIAGIYALAGLSNLAQPAPEEFRRIEIFEFHRTAKQVGKNP